MSIQWNARKLDELGRIGRGRSRHRPRNDPSLYGGQYPFFQTGDVKAASLYLRQYSQTYNDVGLSQSKLWKPGTLCITIAANIAETAILGVEGCFPDSIVGFEADPEVADVRFVKYHIDYIKLLMQNMSHGTTQDNLSLDKLLRIDFHVPDLPVQQRIVDILSAYDDLIENNERRIRILEEMARTIYREWFVEFRFPGHERVRMVASEVGKIPKGWTAASLGDLSNNFDRLRKPISRAKRLEMQGPYPYYGAAKIVDHVDDYIFDGSYLLIAEDGSVIDAERRPVMQLPWGKFWVNNHAHVIQGKGNISIWYLYLRLREFDVTGCVTGAAQPKITQENLNRIPVLAPSNEVLEAFNHTIGPFFVLRRNLLEKNLGLTASRDLLLPKLLSGNLDLNTINP